MCPTSLLKFSNGATLVEKKYQTLFFSCMFSRKLLAMLLNINSHVSSTSALAASNACNDDRNSSNDKNVHREGLCLCIVLIH